MVVQLLCVIEPGEDGREAVIRHHSTHQTDDKQVKGTIIVAYTLFPLAVSMCGTLDSDTQTLRRPPG